ncbi:MAG TPA: DUF5666 domain-containing protein [Acidimicrobiales bacterium]|nr:DUF5666 domain-containing protein [Acidimicrobiales bacterium]
MSDFDPQPPNPDRDPAPGRSAGARRRLITGALTGAASVLAAVMLTLTTGSSPSDAAAVASSTTHNDPSSPQSGPDTDVTRKGIIGTVTAIDGTTLTVDARPKHLHRRGSKGSGESTGPDRSGARDEPGTTTTYTLTTTDATNVIELTDGTVSDLAEGDTVVVAGKASVGTVAAKRIVQTEREPVPDGQAGPDGPPEANPGPPQDGAEHDGAHQGRRPLRGRLTFGTVTSVDGSTVTIRKASGETLRVTTTPDTAVEVTPQVDFSAIEVGDTVRATGKVSGTKVAATRIVGGDDAVFGPGGRPGRPGPGGPPSTEH